jgi:hypothetical protein
MSYVHVLSKSQPDMNLYTSPPVQSLQIAPMPCCLFCPEAVNYNIFVSTSQKEVKMQYASLKKLKSGTYFS